MRVNLNEHLENKYTLAEFIDAYEISWEILNEYYGNIYDIINENDEDIKETEGL